MPRSSPCDKEGATSDGGAGNRVGNRGLLRPHVSGFVGLDTSPGALADARRLLFPRGTGKHPRVTLLHRSFTSFDPRLAGFDAAVLVETMEHVEPERLSNVERAVFGCYRPATTLW
jgi:small RNA 2'-O-methyltransferase